MSDNNDPYNYDYDTYRPPTLTGEGDVHAPSASPYFAAFDYQSSSLTRDDLEQREEMIVEREKEIETLEKDFSSGEKNNWPICYPFIRHSIFGEIPSGARRAAASMSYLGWFMFSLIILLNLGSAIATVVLDGKIGALAQKKKIQMLFMASVFTLGIPAYFMFAHYPLYHAMRTVNMARFFLFFVGYSALVIFSGFCVSGWVEYGPCGIVGAVQFLQKGLKQKNALAGFIINFSMAGIWLFMALYSFTIFVIAIVVYWKQNSTFAKAKTFAKKRLDARGTVTNNNNGGMLNDNTATDMQTV